MVNILMATFQTPEIIKENYKSKSKILAHLSYCVSNGDAEQQFRRF